jgi:hypothetical protein
MRSSVVAVAVVLAVATGPAHAGKPVAVDRATADQKLNNLVNQLGTMRQSFPQYGPRIGQAQRKLQELQSALSVAPPADYNPTFVVVDRDSFIANVRWAIGLVTSLRTDPMVTEWADAVAPWGEDLVSYIAAAPYGRRRPAYAPPPPPPAPVYAPPPPASVHAPPPSAPVYAPPPPAPTVVVGPWGQPVAPPMDDASFGQLLQTVGNESFDSSKLNVIRTATSNWFTCNQVAQLLGKLTFDDSKVRAVEIVASRIVDRGNAFVLYNAFTFSSSKDRVRQILSR